MSSLDGDYPTFTLAEVIDLEALAAHVQKLKPIVFCMLASYMKHLLPIADVFKKSGVELIVVNSETSSRIERAHFAKVYGLPILDEYSSCEVGIIASECVGGRYHVNADGLLLELPELNDSPGGWGRTVITDLRNTLMPFIRYDQGDIARWAPFTDCSCGQKTQNFIELLGRSDDCFLTNAGREIPSASLLNLLDSIFTEQDTGVSSYRLVENAVDEVALVYVLSDKNRPLREQQKESVRRRLSAIYGYDVKPRYVERDTLEAPNGYKRRKVISNRTRMG
jgi:phenylacetate-CoA ligase